MRWFAAVTTTSLIFSGVCEGSVAATAGAGNIPRCGPPMSPSTSPLRVLAGRTGTVVLTGHLPQKASPKPSSTPKPEDAFRLLQGGAKISSGSYTVVGDDGTKIVVSIMTPSPPKPGTTPAPVPTPTPTPQPTASQTPSISELGPTGQLTARIKDTHIATIASSSPVPLATANASEISVSYTVSGVSPGRTDLVVDDGMTVCAVAVNILPQANRFVVTSGFGSSRIPVNTIVQTLVTPAPVGAPTPLNSPGLYISQTESSDTQTFVPILAHFRLTDSTSQFNLYATAGLAANGDSSKQLFGLSLGGDCFMLTGGFHTAQVNLLSKGLAPGFNPLNALPPMVPPTFVQRTSRMFASFTLPLASLASIIPGLGDGTLPGSACTSSSASTPSTDSSKSKAPSASNTPAPPASASPTGAKGGQ